MTYYHGQLPIEARATEVASLIAPTVENRMTLVEETTTTAGAAELLHSLTHPQVLPLAMETLAIWKDRIAEPTVVGRSILASEANTVDLAREFWAASNRVLAPLVGNDRVLLTPQIGSPDADRFLQKMLPLVEVGSLDRVAAKVRDPYLRSLLPLALLKTTSTALIEEVDRGLSPDERALPENVRITLVLSRAEAKLRTMIGAVVSGKKPGPQPKSKASVAEKVAWGSMEALRRSAYVNTNEIIEPLLIVDLAIAFQNQAFIEGKSLGGLSSIHERRPTAAEARENIFFDMAKIFPTAVGRVARQLTSMGLPYDGPTRPADEERMSRRVAVPGVEVHRNPEVRADVLKAVNDAHARLRMRQITAVIVGGLHSGQFSFMPVYRAGQLLHTSVLGERAAEIAAVRQAEQERLAGIREQERLAKEAEIQAQLAAMGVNWLSKELFPTSAGHAIPRPRGVAASDSPEVQHNERELDEYRLRGLLHLQAVTGGQRWESSFRLRPGEKRERYHVLVFTIGDVAYAVAECAEVNNAMYLWRSDRPNIEDWRLVFSQDKTSAFANGALPLAHPKKGERAADPEGSAIRFADAAFDIITGDLTEFMTRWLKERARARGRGAIASILEQ